MLDLYFQSQTDPVMRFAICGLPAWTGIARNDTAAFINDILVATVNGPCAIFAFLSNLAIIVAVIKNPALQKPCNILLCSLAFADCFTGLTAQPMFVVWRFFLQRAQQSCLHQVVVFDVYYTFNFFTIGLSFVNVVVISFDRYYALSRPLVHLTSVTNKGETFLTSIVTVKLDARPCNYANSYRNVGMFIGSLLCAIFNRREHFAHDGFKFAPVAFSEVFQEHHICTLRVWPIGQNPRRYLL